MKKFFIAAAALLVGFSASAQQALWGKDQTKHLFFPSLQPQLQTGVAATDLGIFRHSGDDIFPSDDNEKLLGTGNGGVENTAVQKVGRAAPGSQNHSPIFTALALVNGHGIGQL